MNVTDLLLGQSASGVAAHRALIEKQEHKTNFVFNVFNVIHANLDGLGAMQLHERALRPDIDIALRLVTHHLLNT